MNFDAEKAKPLAIGDDGNLVTLDEVLLHSRRLSSRRVGHQRNASPLAGFVKAAEAAPEKLTKLIVARLLADRDRQFRLIDGREFSVEQAANEVQKKTEVGDYFKRLELRTIKIVEESLANGEIS